MIFGTLSFPIHLLQVSQIAYSSVASVAFFYFYKHCAQTECAHCEIVPMFFSWIECTH